jgi:hypothetical protein
MAPTTPIHIQTERARLLTHGNSTLLVCKLCMIYSLARIPRASTLVALPSAPHVSASLLSSLHTSSSRCELARVPIFQRSGGLYPASWRLGHNVHIASPRPVFRPSMLFSSVLVLQCRCRADTMSLTASQTLKNSIAHGRWLAGCRRSRF